ncbi:WXG100 family type VII secretion target [Streptomyces sp. CB01635]|uniref:WXG100 family type VII secretion target n=1 Tax=unclassified Streptomyces TaxID=2593676 RepID=UPI000C26F044|nr:WXG100 family type VII secretion target [Streptomyces sp. CB01635]PJN09829.1 WXG100 family type VII secretion target [Streptomyces sp. CB01635]
MGMNHDEMIVKYGALDTAATEIGNMAKQLDADLQEIKTLVAGTVAYWEGETQDTYGTQQKEWDDEARDIHEALKAIGHVVHLAGGDYMGGDKKAASFFL